MNLNFLSNCSHWGQWCLGLDDHGEIISWPQSLFTKAVDGLHHATYDTHNLVTNLSSDALEARDGMLCQNAVSIEYIPSRKTLNSSQLQAANKWHSNTRAGHYTVSFPFTCPAVVNGTLTDCMKKWWSQACVSRRHVLVFGFVNYVIDIHIAFLLFSPSYSMLDSEGMSPLWNSLVLHAGKPQLISSYVGNTSCKGLRDVWVYRQTSQFCFENRNVFLAVVDLRFISV